MSRMFDLTPAQRRLIVQMEPGKWWWAKSGAEARAAIGLLGTLRNPVWLAEMRLAGEEKWGAEYRLNSTGEALRRKLIEGQDG